jgi:hypothetical protein
MIGLAGAKTFAKVERIAGPASVTSARPLNAAGSVSSALPGRRSVAHPAGAHRRSCGPDSSTTHPPPPTAPAREWSTIGRYRKPIPDLETGCT